jgi:hypothetical protein
MPMEIAYSHGVSIIRTLVHERPFSPSTALAWSVVPTPPLPERA